MLFGQLVCYGCQRILTYPLGVITCRCRICNTVNAAQNMEVTCGACGQTLHAPINTLSLLCPCCGTVTDIPEELLPPLPSCINLGDGSEEMETVIYVSQPALQQRARPSVHERREEVQEVPAPVENNKKENASSPPAVSSSSPVVDASNIDPTPSPKALVPKRSPQDRLYAMLKESKRSTERWGLTRMGIKEKAGEATNSDAGGERNEECREVVRREEAEKDVISPPTAEAPAATTTVAAEHRAAIPTRLAPTVMIATRIL